MKKIILIVILVFILVFSPVFNFGYMKTENAQNAIIETVNETDMLEECVKESEKTEDEIAYEYIGNINTYKFHFSSCNRLPNEENRIYMESREEAVEMEFVPCYYCCP